MATQTQNEKMDKIGALWEKTSQNGFDYFSGEVEVDGVKTRFVIYPSKFKDEKPNNPSHIIYLSKPLPNADGSNKPAATKTQKAKAPATVKAADLETEEEADGTDIF